MTNELYYVFSLQSKQALRYIPGLFSGTLPVYVFLIIIFILTYYSFVELFNYYLKMDSKWTNRISKEYEKIPLVKRLLMIPVFKTVFYDNCKHKKALKNIVVLFIIYLVVSVTVIVYEIFTGSKSEILEFGLVGNVYFLTSLAFCVFFNYYIRRRSK